LGSLPGLPFAAGARAKEPATALPLANIFADNMLLQQRKPGRIWG